MTAHKWRRGAVTCKSGAGQTLTTIGYLYGSSGLAVHHNVMDFTQGTCGKTFTATQQTFKGNEPLCKRVCVRRDVALEHPGMWHVELTTLNLLGE